MLIYSFVKLFHVTKRNQNNFRSVIKPNGDNTVSYSPADDHGGVFLCELARIILRDKSLVGGHQAADKRQAELAAMGMTREYQIHSSIDIEIEQLRTVG